MNDQTADSESTQSTRESTRKFVPVKPIYLLFGMTLLASLSVIALTGLPNRSAFHDGSAAQTISPVLPSGVTAAEAPAYPLADAIVRYEEGLVDYDIPFGIGTV